MSPGASESPSGPRAYLRRRGRLTRAQSRALTELSDHYCLSDHGAGVIDPESAFGRTAPLGLEIGFGTGQALVHWALERPDCNLIGVEVYQPGIGAALRELERTGIENVRLMEASADRVLTHCIAPDSLDEIRVFFPDPWPKKRHHKRRLVQAGFVRLLAGRLKPGGLVWLATDWEDYARSMTRLLDAEAALLREDPRVHEGRRGIEPVDGATDGTGNRSRPATRFEARALRLGNPVRELRYCRKR